MKIKDDIGKDYFTVGDKRGTEVSKKDYVQDSVIDIEDDPVPDDENNDYHSEEN